MTSHGWRAWLPLGVLALGSGLGLGVGLLALTRPAVVPHGSRPANTPSSTSVPGPHASISGIVSLSGKPAEDLLYVPSTREVWVASCRGQNVHILPSDLSTHVTRGLPAGSCPRQMAAAAGSDLVYVADPGQGSVDAVARRANAAVAVVRLGRHAHPSVITYDSGAGLVVVADPTTGTIVELSPVTMHVVHVVTLTGTVPVALAYDAATRATYVLDARGALWRLDAGAGRARALVSWAGGSIAPVALGVNPTDGTLDVLDGLGDRVVYVNPTTGATLGTTALPASIGTPTGAGDLAVTGSGDVVVAGQSSRVRAGQVAVVDPRTGGVSVVYLTPAHSRRGPLAVMVDPLNQHVIVSSSWLAGTSTSGVSLFSLTIGS